MGPSLIAPHAVLPVRKVPAHAPGAKPLQRPGPGGPVYELDGQTAQRSGGGANSAHSSKPLSAQSVRLIACRHRLRLAQISQREALAASKSLPREKSSPRRRALAPLANL